MTLTDRIFI